MFIFLHCININLLSFITIDNFNNTFPYPKYPWPFNISLHLFDKILVIDNPYLISYVFIWKNYHGKWSDLEYFKIYQPQKPLKITTLSLYFCCNLISCTHKIYFKASLYSFNLHGSQSSYAQQMTFLLIIVIKFFKIVKEQPHLLNIKQAIFLYVNTLYAFLLLE